MHCFTKSVKYLVRGDPLQATSLCEYKAWGKKAKKHLQTALELQSQAGQSACIPAPHLVSVIVQLTIRRVRINTNSFAEDNQPFTRVFGHCHMSQWLPIAIKVYEQIHNEPLLTKKTYDGNEVWIVYNRGLFHSRPRAMPV
ncbi:hypothetical protein FAGAP_2703 [Fusarium agapanthi]|uniref:Uncharacterized protein n=1 Tax=Fusarium agapanthi TaxID=1803897 RepID=A0A9P5BGC0_9HYPO|nr:hypothetical protein FAGAP_2703 [Fusarium agapanthi]